MQSRLALPEIVHRVLDLAVEIQQIPAPTLSEGARAEFVRQRFQAAGLSASALRQVETDAVGNVLACWPGEGLAPPLVISAHLDTVFPFGTDLSVRRSEDRIHGPGIGDNSLGVAALFGLLWHWQQQMVRLPGDVWLVANVGEEGLGDLLGMRHVVQRFGATPKAYLILEGMALGHIYHRALGVQRYRLTVQTAGGHSWVDYGRPSAVHELARLVTRLLELPVPAQPRSSLNVGVIHGGTSVNTIAAQASLELDIRSESPTVLASLCRQVENLANAAQTAQVQVMVEVIGHRPAGELSADHPLVALAQTCLREQGLEADLHIGSTDANVPLSLGLPALCLGVTYGAGAHTLQEFIYTAPVQRGLQQLLSFVERVFQE